MAEDPTQAFMAGEHSNSSSVSAHPVPVVASSSAAQPSPEAPRAPVVVTAEEVQAMKESSPYLDTSYPMTAYEWFKLVLLLPWVIIKLPIALIGFILVWSITKLIILGSPINEPLSPTRSRIMRPFLSFWADILIRIGFSFWRLPIRGREHIKAAEDARAIIAFNHVSYMDPYVMVKVKLSPFMAVLVLGACTAGGQCSARCMPHLNFHKTSSGGQLHDCLLDSYCVNPATSFHRPWISR